MHAGVDVPNTFPNGYEPVFGMSVKSCVEYYNGTVGYGTWDIESVARRAQLEKETIYQELTADGIQAFSGARALLLEARSLGVSVAVGSSGVAAVVSLADMSFSCIQDARVILQRVLPGNLPLPASPVMAAQWSAILLSCVCKRHAACCAQCAARMQVRPRRYIET
jgi:beta-phosphoglucomutase-like phosphatase (HAD superfamily)